MSNVAVKRGSADPLSENRDIGALAPQDVIPLPRKPTTLRRQLRSPAVTRALDRIRRSENIDRVDVTGEFDWFTMEYPRIFRYHISHAEYRLEQIFEGYVRFHAYCSKELATMSPHDKVNTLSLGVSDEAAYRVFWNFEAMLSAISSALDILARILSTAFPHGAPASFRKFCGRTSGRFTDIMRKAEATWVNRLKDYRDCFVHYTPIDRLSMLRLDHYSNGFEVRAKLPINPNVRESELFRYSRRCELLRYSIYVYKRLRALDKELAAELTRQFAEGGYPQRLTGLFSISQRQRGTVHTRAQK